MTRESNIKRLINSTEDLWSSEYLVYKYLNHEIYNAANLFAKGKLLDIGCGNKPYYRLFEPLVESYIGCDIVQSSENRVDIICEATQIPVDDNSFDTVFSTQVIEHVAEHQVMLNESYRVLKPGGRIILSGPSYWPIHEAPYDFFRFTKFGMQHIFEKAGFQNIQIITCGSQWALRGIVFLYSLPGRPRLLNRLFNPLFALLEQKFPDENYAVNYLVIAHKA
jgi:SAM-dependent methyltransferase